MVDIIGLLHSVICRWNEEEKCGYCWEYEAPLRESDLNESEPKDERCCVRVFLTDFTINKNRRYNNSSHYMTGQTNSYSFILNVLMQDGIDTNVYLEQEGHPLGESKWKRILKPLMLCIQDLDFCEDNAVLTYASERWEPAIDVYHNYTGWRIN